MNDHADIPPSDPSEVLWVDLLENKNFFGYEFFRNRNIGDVSFDFICPEVKFAIKIQTDKKHTLSTQQKETIVKAGYRLVILSKKELTDEFNTAAEYLTDQFSDLIRFKCNC